MKLTVPKVVWVVALHFLFSIPSYGALVFRMEIDNPVIDIGQQATVSIFANIEEELSGLNGLNFWQLDMVVDNGNMVTVKEATIALLAPTPMDMGLSGHFSVNNPVSGSVRGLTAFSQVNGQDSSTGVGGFSLLAKVTVEAIGPGNVTYSLADAGIGFGGILRNGQFYDASIGNVVFTGGNNTITITAPEPTSILLLAAMSIISLRIRRNRV